MFPELCHTSLFSESPLQCLTIHPVFLRFKSFLRKFSVHGFVHGVYTVADYYGFTTNEDGGSEAAPMEKDTPK